MSRTDKIISRFLVELHSENVQGLFEQLEVLMDHLEEKNDPDPTELQIVNSIYQALEQIKTLEAYLTKRVSEKSTFTGDKLQALYEKTPSSVGSQILFER